MHSQPTGRRAAGWRSVVSLLATGSMVLLLALVPTTVQALDPGTTAEHADSLDRRLPASVAGHPIRVDPGTDLGTWIEDAYPDETPPELETLDAALMAQGATRADVRLAWAVAGDTELVITGFQLAGGDAEALRDPILGVYMVGMGPLVKTEQAVGGQPVLIMSQGPLEADPYPFGLLVDGDIVWIASASPDLLRSGLEALVGAANGTVPRYDPALGSAGPAYTAPWGWDGTVTQTITWDQGSYRGTSVGRHTGSWLQPPTLAGYCERDCTVYVPTGIIDWSWDVSAPTRPPCSASTRGSLRPGAVTIPQDQMLYLDPTGDGHVRLWGSGSFRLPDQPCVGWESDRGPNSFLEIPAPEDDQPFADEMSDPFPNCNDRQWRIKDSATRITGRCWQYHGSGYEDMVEWDLVAIEQ